MSLTEADVQKIAKLARIAISKGELSHFSQELSRILDLAAELQAVNTDNVIPMASTAHLALSMREDKVTDGNMVDKILANAPQTECGYFVVTKVIE